MLQCILGMTYGYKVILRALCKCRLHLGYKVILGGGWGLGMKMLDELR